MRFVLKWDLNCGWIHICKKKSCTVHTTVLILQTARLLSTRAERRLVLDTHARTVPTRTVPSRRWGTSAARGWARAGKRPYRRARAQACQSAKTPRRRWPGKRARTTAIRARHAIQTQLASCMTLDFQLLFDSYTWMRFACKMRFAYACDFHDDAILFQLWLLSAYDSRSAMWFASNMRFAWLMICIEM